MQAARTPHGESSCSIHRRFHSLAIRAALRADRATPSRDAPQSAPGRRSARRSPPRLRAPEMPATTPALRSTHRPWPTHRRRCAWAENIKPAMASPEETSRAYHTRHYDLEDSQLVPCVFSHSIGRPRRLHNEFHVYLADAFEPAHRVLRLAQKLRTGGGGPGWHRPL